MKSKKTLNTRVIVPVVAFGIVAIATLNSVTLVNAQNLDSGNETLISRIASRFGLNETEVEDTFDEFRAKRGEERHQRMEERLRENLDSAVEDGNLTEEQRFAVLEKHEELENKFDDLYDLSPEDRREARADIREEMDAWAEENGIDMANVHQFEFGMNGDENGNRNGNANGAGRFMGK